MKIGMCASVFDIGKYAVMGFDYVEVSATALMALSLEEFERAVAAAGAASIGVEAANILFPGGGEIRLIGADRNPEETALYLREAVRRASILGVGRMAFGSGGLRRIPEGMDRQAGITQVREAVAAAAALMAERGVTLMLEPLNKGETNVVNTLPEGAALLGEWNIPNARLLADYYHMRRDAEPMTNVVLFGDRIVHAHIACPEMRAYPLPGDGERYGGFFRALEEIGYEGRLSIEGHGVNDDEAKRSLEYLRKLTMNN